MSWVESSDLCEGCKVLEAPWAADTTNNVLGGLFGAGADPSYYSLGRVLDNGTEVSIVRHDDEGVLFTTRTDFLAECGRLPGLAFSQNGTELGAYLYNRIGQDAHLFLAVPTQASDELLDQTPSLQFNADIVASSGINAMRFSERFVVVDLSGRILVGNRSSGEVTDISALPDAPPGYQNDFAVGDDVVFASHNDGTRVSWWAYAEGRMIKVLGDDSTTIAQLGSDGSSVIWTQAKTSVGSDGAITSSAYDLYVARADRELSDRRLIRAGIEQNLSWWVLANGLAVGLLEVPGTGSRLKAWVIELATGRIYESVLPQDYGWGYVNYPTQSELWGAIGANRPLNHWKTYARVPYDQMEVIQSSAP